ncbi:MAG: presenilin family intramembrane aspartyl protease [Candidatus Bathyarchaeota archaeon]|nr:presenilin family intramembrane aspartyl protease [Candidatus Bathyarchaeota archaeon]
MTEPTKQQPTQVPAKSEQDRFKFEIVYLMPILASLLFGLGCAYLLAPQQASSIPVTPIPEETPGAPFGNALYFVVLIAISATVFYFLLKKRSKRIIKALIVVAMSTAALLLSLVYLSAVLPYFEGVDYVWIGLSVAITVLFDLAVFRFPRARNIAVICLGGALGVFFGKFIPLWSAVLILAFLAVYDVVAVYKGPVGKIAESGLEQLHGLSYSFKDIQMGLGDLVFYSMLVGAVFFNFNNLFPTILSIVGIMAGSILTFYMLEKKGIFPGLPFPILLGLTLGLIAGFLL